MPSIVEVREILLLRLLVLLLEEANLTPPLKDFKPFPRHRDRLLTDHHAIHSLDGLRFNILVYRYKYLKR